MSGGRKNLSADLRQVVDAARSVEAIQEELDDAVEVLNSQVNVAVQEGASVEEVAELLGVTGTEVDKMIAADRERVRKWREEQQTS